MPASRKAAPEIAETAKSRRPMTGRSGVVTEGKTSVSGGPLHSQRGPDFRRDRTLDPRPCAKAPRRSSKRSAGSKRSRQCAVCDSWVCCTRMDSWQFSGKLRPHQAHAGCGSSGHRCRSNLFLRYSSAPTASRACVAGVKNLRWHLVHDAIAGTLPTYLTMTKLRSAMAGNTLARLRGCAYGPVGPQQKTSITSFYSRWRSLIALVPLPVNFGVLLAVITTVMVYDNLFPLFFAAVTHRVILVTDAQQIKESFNYVPTPFLHRHQFAQNSIHLGPGTNRVLSTIHRGEPLCRSDQDMKNTPAFSVLRRGKYPRSDLKVFSTWLLVCIGVGHGLAISLLRRLGCVGMERRQGNQEHADKRPPGFTCREVSYSVPQNSRACSCTTSNGALHSASSFATLLTGALTG